MNKENTVAEIKEYLDQLGIEYNAKATKEELLSLIPSEELEEDIIAQDVINEGPKKFKVIAQYLLNVRNKDNEIEYTVARGDIITGQLVNDKVVLEDGNAVVAEFVEEVR